MAAWYWILVACGCVYANTDAHSESNEEWKSREPQRELVTVDNGIIRVGVDTSRGGSITYLSGQYMYITLWPW